jgi:hypothetical protein
MTVCDQVYQHSVQMARQPIEARSCSSSRSPYDIRSVFTWRLDFDHGPLTHAFSHPHSFAHVIALSVRMATEMMSCCFSTMGHDANRAQVVDSQRNTRRNTGEVSSTCGVGRRIAEQNPERSRQCGRGSGSERLATMRTKQMGAPIVSLSVGRLGHMHIVSRFEVHDGPNGTGTAILPRARAATDGLTRWRPAKRSQKRGW